MDGLTEGRIVHFVLGDLEHRAAMVCRVFRNPAGTPPANGCCNLQVFMDTDPQGQFNDRGPQLSWETSVLYSEENLPNTWHWIERA